MSELVVDSFLMIAANSSCASAAFAEQPEYRHGRRSQDLSAGLRGIGALTATLTCDENAAKPIDSAEGVDLLNSFIVLADSFRMSSSGRCPDKNRVVVVRTIVEGQEQ
jgi:hypothetical protein